MNTSIPQLLSRTLWLACRRSVDEERNSLENVHCHRWYAQYDEWCPAATVLDIPHSFLYSESPQALKNVSVQLGIAIKEALHCQRKMDVTVDIRLPIVKDLFGNFARIGEPHARWKGHYGLQKLTNFNSLLGEDWFIRVINQAGDFAYIIKGTAQFHLLERAI